MNARAVKEKVSGSPWNQMVAKSPWGRKRALKMAVPLLLVVVLVSAGAAFTDRRPRRAIGSKTSFDEYMALGQRIDTSLAGISRLLGADDAPLDIADKPAEPVGEPADSVVNRVGRLRLEGIAWNASRPIAFVNGTVVLVGSEIEGLRVTEITEHAVRFADEQGHSAELSG